VRRSGVAVPREEARTEETAAQAAMSRAALTHLDQVESLDAAPEVVVAQLRQILRSRLNDGDGTAGNTIEPTLRQLRRDLIAVEAAELTRLYEDGVIGAGTRRQLQRRLDLEDASLGE
jgi:CPA1 family monovalent cation:H+ antiporter